MNTQKEYIERMKGRRDMKRLSENGVEAIVELERMRRTFLEHYSTDGNFSPEWIKEHTAYLEPEGNNRVMAKAGTIVQKRFEREIQFDNRIDDKVIDAVFWRAKSFAVRNALNGSSGPGKSQVTLVYRYKDPLDATGKREVTGYTVNDPKSGGYSGELVGENGGTGVIIGMFSLGPPCQS